MENETTKTLSCGCVEDTLNHATVSFCEKHLSEHNDWIESQNLEVL